MSKKILSISVILCMISIIVCAVLIVCKDNIVIYYGIRTYKTIENVWLVAGAVSAMTVIVSCMINRKSENKYVLKDEPMERSRFNDYERRKLYNDIYEEVSKKWKDLKAPLNELLRYLDDMGEQRKSLKRLLESNVSEDIEDTPELLHKVEDCMYTNVRKLLNYAYVISVSDMGAMRYKIYDCKEKNEVLLKQAQDFTLAVADYINNGVEDDDRSLALVNTYRDTVLATIDKTDIYLN